MRLEPEFLEVQEKRLVALSRDYTIETRKDIPELWNDFWAREWKLMGIEEQAAYGVSYSVRPDGRFSYAAGRNIDPIPEPLPEGACIVTLSAGRYAVFRTEGAVTEIPKLFDAIFSQWLPNSGEKQREGAVFERYPYDENASPKSMVYEIWVPVAS
ncbi:MAG: GyrI-like domain-containing protein [Deltaproteobacteria bacterium]|nr:GyrI-like domain-containing protein [Deltaproteobacteria bacterium]